MASNRLYIDMEKKFPMIEKIKVKANEKFTNPIEQIKHDSIGRKSLIEIDFFSRS